MKFIFFIFSIFFIFVSCAPVSQNKDHIDYSQQKDELKTLKAKVDILEQRLELEKEIRENKDLELKEWVKNYVKEYFKSQKNSEKKESKTVSTKKKSKEEKRINKHYSKSKHNQSPTAFYHDALTALRKDKNIKKARALFEEFIKKFPKHRLIPNCYYWLGECYYTVGNYPKAILTFKEIPNRFPKSSKAPDALLKIGYSYWNLKQIDNAKFYLNRLISLYPKSSAALLAKEFLKKVRNESSRK